MERQWELWQPQEVEGSLRLCFAIVERRAGAPLCLTEVQKGRGGGSPLCGLWRGWGRRTQCAAFPGVRGLAVGGAVVGAGRRRPCAEARAPRAGWGEAGRGAGWLPPSRAVAAAAAAAPGSCPEAAPGPRPRVSSPSPGLRAPPAPEAPAHSFGRAGGQPAGRGGAGAAGGRRPQSGAARAGRARRALS